MGTPSSHAHSQIRSSWRRLLGPALAVWAALALIAVLNGIFREAVARSVAR